MMNLSIPSVKAGWTRTDWQPVVSQGHALSVLIESAWYIDYGDWAVIQGALRIESTGLLNAPVEIHNLPLEPYIGFGKISLSHSGVHYIQDIWLKEDHLVCGTYGEVPEYLGRSPAVTLEPGDIARFEVNFSSKAGLPHPGIPVNMEPIGL